MTDIAVNRLLAENQVGGEDYTVNIPSCFLDENILNDVESEEEDQPLDIAQLCLKAELATVLADQVEMLREKNIVQSQAVHDVIIFCFL